jgi:hypothetical protein
MNFFIRLFAIKFKFNYNITLIFEYINKIIMVRDIKRGRTAPLKGISSVFAPSKYALAFLTYQRFSYMKNCIGYYSIPYIGRKRINEMLDINSGCCSINGNCTTPENAMQNGTCYLIIMVITFSILAIVSVSNLIQYSEINNIKIGSLIIIGADAIQIFQVLLILFNRRNLLSFQCFLFNFRVIATIACLMVLGIAVPLSVTAHNDNNESKAVNQATGLET